MYKIKKTSTRVRNVPGGFEYVCSVDCCFNQLKVRSDASEQEAGGLKG